MAGSLDLRHTEAVRAAARLSKVAAGALSETDLTLPQYRVLVFLDNADRPATQVAALLGVTPSTITSVVDGLTARGLVERLPDPDDRRRVMLNLTDDGRTLLATGDDLLGQRLERLLGRLPAHQAETVLSGLEHLNHAMDLALDDLLGSAVDPAR